MLKTSIGEKKFLISDSSILEGNKMDTEFNDLILATSYGNKALGMPNKGINDRMTED